MSISVTPDKYAQQKKITSACQTYSELHQIGSIDKKLLEQNCICIPAEGFIVERGVPVIPPVHQVEEWEFPHIRGNSLKASALKMIGHFNVKNDTGTFIYTDGKTYITADPEVIRALITAGFSRDRNLHVPFGRGGRPSDKDAGPRWDRLKRATRDKYPGAPTIPMGGGNTP